MRNIRKPFLFLLFLCIMIATAPALAVGAEWAPPTSPTASSVYLINSDTGTVLYSKNADQKVYPASITKLMTAILTVEKFKDLDTVITVQASDIKQVPYESSMMGTGLVAGEQIKVRDLLYGLLLPSGNDAAIVLARAAAQIDSPNGTVETFVSMMNAKAKEIGCTNTHYVNPHGFQADGQDTTAKDVYLIAKYAMTDKTVGETLAGIVKTTSYTVKTNKQTYYMNNVNKMLVLGTPYYYQYVKGIKTGSTSNAGDCLVSYASNGGMTYYCVVMNSKQVDKNCTGAFADTKPLLSWAVDSFAVKDLLEKGSMQAQVKLQLAWNKPTLKLYAGTQFNALIPKNTDVTKVKIVPQKNLDKLTLMAPVKKNQKICTANVMLGDQKLGTVDLVSSENVARSAPLYFVYMVGRFFSSKWFKVISVVLIALLLVFFTLSFVRTRRKKRSRRRKKVYKLPR